MMMERYCGPLSLPCTRMPHGPPGGHDDRMQPLSHACTRARMQLVGVGGNKNPCTHAAHMRALPPVRSPPLPSPPLPCYLPVRRRGVVHREEDLQDVAVRQHVGVVLHLHHLGMPRLAGAHLQGRAATNAHGPRGRRSRHGRYRWTSALHISSCAGPCTGTGCLPANEPTSSARVPLRNAMDECTRARLDPLERGR